MRGALAGAGFGTLAAAMGVAMLVPLWILFKVSVSGPEDVLTQHPPFLIRHFTLEHWRNILQPELLFPPLRKSLVVATGTALAAVAIAAPGAYVISRLPVAPRHLVLVALLATRMFPEAIIALPIAVSFLRLNLTDTDVGLILAHLIRSLPLVAWVLVGTFAVIPRDLEEAATVDGAGRFATLRAVVLPLALPGIAAGAILAWLDSWNDLQYAIYLLLSDRTLPLMTYFFANRGQVFDVATYAVIQALPVMAVTLVLQRHIRAGYLSGAIRG